MGIHLTIDLCWRSWSATWQKRRKIIRCQRQRRRLNNEHDEEEREDVSDDQSGRLDEQNWGFGDIDEQLFIGRDHRGPAQSDKIYRYNDGNKDKYKSSLTLTLTLYNWQVCNQLCHNMY